MSMRDKLLRAAAKAANEATQNERGRVLWLLERIEKEIEEALSRKLLVESERHAIQTKLVIFRSLSMQLRRGIVSGVRPQPRKPHEDDRGALPPQRRPGA